MASHVMNLYTEFEDPGPMHSWVMSHWLPWEMLLQPLCMYQITWSVYRGQK